MILFKPEHVEKILRGEKTQTRRLHKHRDQRPRWKVGAVHACYTKPPFARGGAEPFARVRIAGVRRECLRHITDEDVRREGYSTRAEFLEVFRRINGREYDGHAAHVWVVDFELVEPRA